jgi:hypothetical protein
MHLKRKSLNLDHLDRRNLRLRAERELDRNGTTKTELSDIEKIKNNTL